MFVKSSKGQSTLEYVILIGFIVAALIAMGIYMKRGFQGRLRESTDQVGEQFSANNTASKYTTTTNISQFETLSSGGLTKTAINLNRQAKEGGETVEAFGSGD